MDGRAVTTPPPDNGAADCLLLDLTSSQRTSQCSVPVKQAVIAGWTGRDPVALEKHIRELEELGVTRPASTPVFYRISASRLTVRPQIEATGLHSSGEVEFVLLQFNNTLWVGVGSDHTDRNVETYNVTVSKQMCDKPIAPAFWDYKVLANHWDRLILRSTIQEDGGQRLYQEGSVANMRSPEDLVALYTGNGTLPEGTLMFCGTLAAKGGIRPSAQFEFEIEDPVLKRKIGHSYSINTLPIL